MKNTTVLSGLGFVVWLLLAGWVGDVSAEPARVVPGSRAEMQLSFAELVDKTSPSVVNIYARRRTRARINPFGDSFFNQFFPGFEMERRENSLGSGVVVDEGGLILTNLHVLEGAEDITVVDYRRREYRAELVQADRNTDLAVIRIDSGRNPLPTLPLGDVNRSKVGDLVLAIGNPFGVAQTVTSGIISGLTRTSVNDNRYQAFVQTDAAINPGNSGGALVNMQGELIGINTAIISPTGSSSGLGFAIPVNMVRPVLYAAREDIPLNRAWLGFEPQAVDWNSAEAIGLSSPRGVLVGDVLAGSPADRVGLKSGDLILKVNDIPLENSSHLYFFIASLVPEYTRTVSFRLHGRASAVDFPVEFPPAEPPLDQRQLKGRHILGGAAILNISPFVTEHFRLPLGESGVMIQTIPARSPAKHFGFQERDILRTLNGYKVESVAQLERMLRQRAPGEWRVRVSRDRKEIEWRIR